MQATWHIGITGGIGSGKSTVCKMLAGYGATVLDADAISRACTAANGAAMAAIQSAFGDAYIGETGALNRAAMRERIFRDPEARKQLQDIIHPVVMAQMLAQGQEAQQQGKPLVLYDIPLLAESQHWRSHLQGIIVVDCDEATQIKRVMQRSQLAYDEVKAIIAAQSSREARLQIADMVIDNGSNTNWQHLEQQIQQLAVHFGLIIATKELHA